MQLLCVFVDVDVLYETVSLFSGNMTLVLLGKKTMMQIQAVFLFLGNMTLMLLGKKSKTQVAGQMHSVPFVMHDWNSAFLGTKFLVDI